MSNQEIINKAAVSSGLFTAEEAEAILSTGRRLPLHTYSEWKRLGYQVKEGEHAALTVQLWKYRSEIVEIDGQEVESGDCHRANAHLFTAQQVKKSETCTVKTREELMAYNKMLAEQRKAHRAAAVA